MFFPLSLVFYLVLFCFVFGLAVWWAMLSLWVGFVCALCCGDGSWGICMVCSLVVVFVLVVLWLGVVVLLGFGLFCWLGFCFVVLIALFEYRAADWLLYRWLVGAFFALVVVG